MNAIVFHVEPRTQKTCPNFSALCYNFVVTNVTVYCTIFCHCNSLLFIQCVNYGSVVLSAHYNGFETMRCQILYFK